MNKPMTEAAIDKWLDDTELSLSTLRHTLHVTAKTTGAPESETQAHAALLAFRTAVSGLDDAVMHRIYQSAVASPEHVATLAAKPMDDPEVDKAVDGTRASLDGIATVERDATATRDSVSAAKEAFNDSVSTLNIALMHRIKKMKPKA